MKKAQDGKTIKSTRIIGDTTGLGLKKRVSDVSNELDRRAKAKNVKEFAPAERVAFQKSNPLNKPTLLSKKSSEKLLKRSGKK